MSDGENSERPADNKHLTLSPEAAEEAVWAARLMLLSVFKRAHTCARPKCRRKGYCLAGWDSTGAGFNPLWAPTGGCPVMTAAEWEVVQLGVVRQRMLVMDYVNAWHAAKDAGRLPPALVGPAKPQMRRPFRWVEWLAVDAVEMTKTLDRESAAFEAAQNAAAGAGAGGANVAGAKARRKRR